MIGVDPRPFTLRRLDQMACGRWAMDADVLGQVLPGLFSKEAAAAVRNPFDRRANAPLPPAAAAEEAAAKARVDEIRQRVRERQLARATNGTQRQ